MTADAYDKEVIEAMRVAAGLQINKYYVCSQQIAFKASSQVARSSKYQSVGFAPVTHDRADTAFDVPVLLIAIRSRFS